MASYRRRAKRRAGKPPKPLWLSSLIGLVVIAMLGGAVTFGYLTYAAQQVSSKVFDGGGVEDLIAGGQALKTDDHGRINVLVFGTSHDDKAHSEGVGGQGMWLTDSIQLISIDPHSKKAGMISIPRDTWVRLPRPCIAGYSVKINAVFECGAAGDWNSDDYYPAFLTSMPREIPQYRKRVRMGARALMSMVGEVTGVRPSYFVHVNYSMLRELVDALGGVKVEIVGNGHVGIYDTNLDVDCDPDDKSCRRIYYPHDGTYELDGQHALDLARARGDGRYKGAVVPENTYACMQFGLDGGEFDRQRNQQRIITGIKDRAVSAGTLANPLKIKEVMDAVGNNMITNLNVSEFKTAAGLGNKMGAMEPVNLSQGRNAVLEMTRLNDTIVVLPKAGQDDWSEVHSSVADQLQRLLNPAHKPTPSTVPSPSPTRSRAPSSAATTPGTGTSKPTATTTAKPTEEPSKDCIYGR